MSVGRRVLQVVVMVASLAACRVDAAVDVAVQPDGSGQITLTATADAEVIRAAPLLAQDLRLDDARSAGWIVDGPTPTADDGLRLVLTHPFSSVEEATALLASVNGVGGPLQNVALTRTARKTTTTFTLSGSLRVDGGLTAFADPDLLGAIGGTPYAEQVAAANLSPAQAVGLTFSVHLPGTIAPTSGSVNAGTVTWAVPLDGSPVDLVTTATDDGGSKRWWAIVSTVSLIAMLAWTALAAAFVVWVVRQRRRRQARRATA